ncbi:L-lactate MFS transporter [Gudongella sp. DL1XJH-153]|uniref:L-lactate MFS transporter n=1 Tax=Gudongella sp. DL1XJH-153 TaxID=3409804 RepID=UPI003BB6DFAB
MSLSKFNTTIVNSRWKYILLGILIMMLLGTVYSYSIFRVELQNELKVGLAESGMPYMFALAFYALFMLLSGKHIERFQPRNTIIIGGLLVSLGWILSSFATNIFLLTIAYGCISGAGVGIAYGVLMNVIAKWFPDKKGIASGLVLVGFGLSPLITAPLARTLVENYGVMRTFLVLGAGFGILIPLMALPFKYPENEAVYNYKNKKNHFRISKEIPLVEMIRTRTFKGIYLNFIIGTMVGLTMIGMTTNVGIDHFELDASMVTGLMALFAIFNGVGRPIFGLISDHFSPRHAMILSYLMIMAAAIAIISLENSSIVYIVTFSIFWLNLGGWLAIAPTSTLKFFGMKNYSENYGLVFTAYGIGAIVGVSTSGVILDYLGSYIYVFYYIIVLCLIGISITHRYIHNEPQIE